MIFKDQTVVKQLLEVFDQTSEKHCRNTFGKHVKVSEMQCINASVYKHLTDVHAEVTRKKC
jgi:hypothetical protein